MLVLILTSTSIQLVCYFYWVVVLQSTTFKIALSTMGNCKLKYYNLVKMSDLSNYLLVPVFFRGNAKVMFISSLYLSIPSILSFHKLSNLDHLLIIMQASNKIRSSAFVTITELPTNVGAFGWYSR